MPESPPMNRIIENLSGYRNWVEVDRDAIRHNLRVAVESGLGVLAIIKADGYGHGALEIARALKSESGLEGFGVATLEEAVDLRKGGITNPILLLGTALESEQDEIIETGIWASVSSIEEAKSFNTAAARLQKHAHIHLMVDTGMGREGVPEHLFDQAMASQFAQMPHLEVMGLGSHCPSADEDPGFTRNQINRFQDVIHHARKGGLNPRLIHLANSAGVLGYDEGIKITNCVRPGLMLYGVSPIREKQAKLRPALTLKARIILVREIPPNHGISYGRSYMTSNPTKVATLGIGYGDGLMRHLSGKGFSILINGERCPLLGRVTMDQIMVDVTHLGDSAVEGDVAVLLGEQGDDCVHANEMADLAGTIPWEIFTSISSRVKRVYVN